MKRLGYFVALTGPVVAYGAFAFVVSGMGGAYDQYAGTWIDVARRLALPVAAVYWIIAALLLLHFTLRARVKKPTAGAKKALVCSWLLNLFVFYLLVLLPLLDGAI